MALITNNISGSSSDSWRIGITGSVRIANPGAGAFPAMPGSDVDFFVSGSRGGKGTSGVSVFGGDAVVSGSLTIGTGSIFIDSNEIRFYGDNPNASNPPKITSSSLGLTFFDAGNTGGVALSSLSAAGDVDGPASSTDNAIARFDSTSGKLIQNSDVTVGDVSAGLSVTLDTSTATRVSLFPTNVTSVIVGKSGADLAISGSFTVKDSVSGATVASISNAGVISGSSNLLAGGALTVNGDAALNGANLTTTATTFNFLPTNATTVNIAGAATTALNIGPSTGNTTVNNNLIVKGDLYISGTTTTIDSTVMEIQDPVIGLGFASGSVAGSLSDRGFIGGLTGENSVAMFWDESDDKFAVARTNTTPTAAAVGANIAVVDYQAFRAGKVHLGGGTNAFVTSSDGSRLKLSAATDLFLDAATGAGANGDVVFQAGGTTYLQISGSGTNTIDIKPAAGVLNANLLNATSTTVNAFGAATSITLGATAGSTTLRNKFSRNGNLSAASWTTSGISTDFAAGTYTDNSTAAAGTVASRAAVSVNTPTYASTNSITVTDAANLYVSSAPAAGTNTTITNAYALWVDAGDSRFDGNILPGTDLGGNLGSATKRWSNVYTGDLHLRNERGDYTLIEEEDFLSIRFNKTGKRYKFLLEPVPELDEK